MISSLIFTSQSLSYLVMMRATIFSCIAALGILASASPADTVPDATLSYEDKPFVTSVRSLPLRLDIILTIRLFSNRASKSMP